MHSREPELIEPDPADDGVQLARALRRLPDVEPPADGWERLRVRLGAPRDEQSRAAWSMLAAAASAVLVALALMLRAGIDDSPPAGPATDLGTVAVGPLEVAAGAPHDTAEWRRRSAELERLLARLPEPRATRASTGLTTAALEDRIALIDEQLSVGVQAGVMPADADSLWRERVMLLDSLVTVRYAAAVDPGI